jgi:hypothetical protein
MFKISLLSAILLFVLVQLAQAKDVSAQQAGYNNALQRMEKAEEEYKADAQAVADTEKVIEKKRNSWQRSKKRQSFPGKTIRKPGENWSRRKISWTKPGSNKFIFCNV